MDTVVPVSSTEVAELTKLLENIYRSVNIALVNELKVLAGEVNTSMPEYVISKLSDVLNNQTKWIRDSKILVLGVAYKKDIDDIRESPAVEIIIMTPMFLESTTWENMI